ncbi:MAG: DUF4268 domain-containing protein [Bacteroidota bacterium]
MKQQIKLHLQKSYPRHWSNISIGSSDAHIALTINSREGTYGIEIYITDNKALYKELFNQKDSIETELKEKADWMGLPKKRQAG